MYDIIDVTDTLELSDADLLITGVTDGDCETDEEPDTLAVTDTEEVSL